MKKDLLIKELEAGKYKELLIDIYEDESLISHEISRYIEAVKKFGEIYEADDVNIYSAPGRSEIGGNHTDHQHGHVLAASINRDTIAVVAPSSNGIVRIVSDERPMLTVNVNDIELKEEEKESSIALVKGVLKGCVDRDYKIGGFDAYITSEVLVGAGLSSSAAYEALIGTIISYLYNNGDISASTIAIIGQYAENVYFGKPCGLMDQMACSVGNMVHINFADPANPEFETVKFDMNKYGYSLCITDTKGSHADLTSEYAAMPIEMKKVAACFGQEVLLGLEASDILSRVGELRDKCGDRAVLRSLHFIAENKRVMQEVDALRREDIDGFMKLVKESGNSSYKFLQNVYTVMDITSQNMSIALAFSEAVLGDCGGVSRVHGGGFAGTIQAFVKNKKVEEYMSAMNSIFGDKSCNVLKIRKYGGMKVL